MGMGLPFIDCEGVEDKDTMHPLMTLDYNGSNGIQPPQRIVLWSGFRKHLKYEYGGCRNWIKSVPPWISEEQLRYHGVDEKQYIKHQKRVEAVLGEPICKPSKLISPFDLSMMQ